MTTSDRGSFQHAHLQGWLEASRRYVLPEQDGLSEVSHGTEVRVVSRARRRVLRLLQRAVQREQDPLQQLERLFYSQVSFIAGHPDVPRRMLGWSLSSNDERIHRHVKSIIRNYETKLARLIDRAKRRGLVKDAIDSRAAASSFVTMIQGLVLRSRSGPDYARHLLREAAKVFPVYLSGMRTRTKLDALEVR